MGSRSWILGCSDRGCWREKGVIVCETILGIPPFSFNPLYIERPAEKQPVARGGMR
jgi:hypothetical protein